MKAELVDGHQEVVQVQVTEIRHLCRDASWVRCPYDALVAGRWCSAPTVACHHRGGTERMPATELRVRSEGRDVPIQAIDVFDIPEDKDG